MWDELSYPPAQVNSVELCLSTYRGAQTKVGRTAAFHILFISDRKSVVLSSKLVPGGRVVTS